MVYLCAFVQPQVSQQKPQQVAAKADSWVTDKAPDEATLRKQYESG
jgi:hypothetical protein